MNNHYKRQKLLKNNTPALDTRPNQYSAGELRSSSTPKDLDSGMLQPLRKMDVMQEASKQEYEEKSNSSS